MKRALSIYLPQFAIWRARRSLRREQPDLTPAPPEATAWLLWSAQRGAQYVVKACPRGEAAGVRPGMTIAHARALLSSVTVHDLEHTPLRDAEALRALARWTIRFAPVVAPDDPDGLFLDIGGCGHLFGGERRHVELIAAAISRWGLTARLAVAPTFGCARAVSRYANEAMSFIPEGGVCGALSPLPVRVLAVEDKVLRALDDVGVERIAHLLAIPRDELAARFGAALLHRLDQATGATPELIHPVASVRHFEVSRDFEAPIEQWTIIEAATRKLLAELLAQARALERGILLLNVGLRRVDLPPETLSLRLTYPTRDEKHLWTLLRPRLERAHMGFGVEAVALRAERMARLLPEQTAFLPDSGSDTAACARALGALVDQLTDRLGDGAVRRARLVESYVPEEAAVYGSVDESALKRPGRLGLDSPTRYSAHRPVQLFEKPEPARVISLVPDGPLAWIEWRGVRADIVSSAGPERITLPWWTGGAAAARDYYEVDDQVGRRLWVFRSPDGGSWYVHGQWA